VNITRQDLSLSIQRTWFESAKIIDETVLAIEAAIKWGKADGGIGIPDYYRKYHSNIGYELLASLFGKPG
jgi:hypothetical protein